MNRADHFFNLLAGDDDEGVKTIVPDLNIFQQWKEEIRASDASSLSRSSSSHLDIGSIEKKMNLHYTTSWCTQFSAIFRRTFYSNLKDSMVFRVQMFKVSLNHTYA
jgi:hypothetical protein